MAKKLFAKEELIDALIGLKDSYKIFAPFKEDDFHVFREVTGDNRPDLDYQNTRLSPKDIIYPQSERMFEYTLDENEADARILKETPKDYTPQVIFGIRPCDAHAFQILNVNFDNPDYSDPWWVRRFQATTLVGLGCNNPMSTCFCTSVGGGPFSKKRLDALAYDLGENFLVESLTEKGESFLSKIQGGKEPADSDLKEAETMALSAEEKITSRVEIGQLKDKKATDLFDAPFWEDVAFPCINCGTCTYLCPTCWCFDIQDEIYGKEGDRIRNWDSCMFPLFTLHGSGHNPRDQKYQRVRQRFMHKLKYYVDKYQNGIQCSGCGRCVRYCPVNIDIREIADKMDSF